jgi:hypothetical protein
VANYIRDQMGFHQILAKILVATVDPNRPDALV